MRELLRFLKPGPFMMWGFSLVFSPFVVLTSSTPESSLLERTAFPAMVVSWVAGIILMIRVRSRGSD
jgi:hypothetical protein